MVQTPGSEENVSARDHVEFGSELGVELDCRLQAHTVVLRDILSLEQVVGSVGGVANTAAAQISGLDVHNFGQR